MLASAYNTQNSNLHQNVGAPCKMLAPYVKCRRLKCRRPMQNVGSLCKMLAPYAKCRRPMQNVGALKCRRLLKNVGAHEIF